MSTSSKQQGYECPKCKNNYSTAYSMYRHMRKVHNCDVNRCVTLYCPIENCNQSYDRYNALDTHLTHVHYADIRKETLNFGDLQDFETWLRDITSSSKTKYIKRSCNNSYRYYRCHRSGLPKTSQDKISSMKSSVKIGRHCPSRIIAKITDRSVQVEFVPTHIGHDCEIAKIPLSQKKRHDIACRLASSNNNSVSASVAAIALASTTKQQQQQQQQQQQHPQTRQQQLTQMNPAAVASTNQNATTVNNLAHHQHNHDATAQQQQQQRQQQQQQQQHLHVNQSVTDPQQLQAPPSQMQSTNGTASSVNATTATILPNDNSLMITLAPMKTTSLNDQQQQQQQQQQHQLGNPAQQPLQQRPPQQMMQTQLAQQQTQMAPPGSNLGLMSLTSPNRQELTNRFEQLLASIRSDKHASIVKAQLEVCFALIRD